MGEVTLPNGDKIFTPEQSFYIEMLDGESTPNLIAKYEPWGFDTGPLKPQTFSKGMLFNFFDPPEEELPTKPVPI